MSEETGENQKLSKKDKLLGFAKKYWEEGVKMIKNTPEAYLVFVVTDKILLGLEKLGVVIAPEIGIVVAAVALGALLVTVIDKFGPVVAEKISVLLNKPQPAYVSVNQ